MIDFGELTGDALIALAQEWRRRALQGDKDARDTAHAMEAEIRGRLGNPIPGMPNAIPGT